MILQFNVQEVPVVRLGDVCLFKSGNSLPDGQKFLNQEHGFLLLKVSDLNQAENIPVIRMAALWAETPVMESTSCKPGAIILPKRGGAIATNKKRLLGRPAALDPNLMGVEPDTNHVDSLYLYYWFQQFDLTQITSGSAVPQLNKQDLFPLKIPLPPLEKQRRIAAILDKADAVRRKRQSAIALTEELLRSAFLEMFGDPIINLKGWNVLPIGAISSRITKGESPKWQGYNYQNEGVLFVTSENVLWGKINCSDPKFIPEQFHQKLNRSQLCANDILINLVGASIGRTCLVPKKILPANVNQAVAVVSLNNQVCDPSFFLSQLLNYSVQKSLLGQAVESARANLSLTNIRELSVIVPPMEYQMRWKHFYQQERLMCERKATSAQELNNLFNSLLQKAFRGEL